MVVFDFAQNFGGYSLDFKPLNMDATGPPPVAARFTFSGRAPNNLRIYSKMHKNCKCYFLGVTGAREWVVRNVAVSNRGSWDVVSLEWTRVWNDGELFKIRGHNGQYVKWAESSGLIATHDPNEASAFKLVRVQSAMVG